MAATNFSGPLQIGGITVVSSRGAAVVNAAAATAVAMSAGGVGTAAGGWDTAANRDQAIAQFAALLTDVASIRTQLNLALAALRTHGLITP